jgi:flavin reductase (DIM6/NTAB) family NADH-FMN oxidoreductase RutF
MNQHEFKNFMSTWTSGVGLIVVRDTVKSHNAVISSLVSLDVENPLLLFVLQKESSTGKAILQNGIFTIHVLNSDAKEFAENFTKPKELRSNFSLLDDGYKTFYVSSIKCRFRNLLEECRSNLYFAEVLDVEVEPESTALVYLNREFHSLEL